MELVIRLSCTWFFAFRLRRKSLREMHSRARLRLKDKLDRLGFRLAYRDLLERRAKLLLPGCDRVITGGQIPDFEAAVFGGDGKKWMLEDRDVASHPRVDVALHRNCDFFTRKRRTERKPGRLCLVELAIVVRRRMDVVRRWIRIDDL